MAEGGNSTNAEQANDLNRRQFFLRLGLGSLSIAAAGTVAFAYEYLEAERTLRAVARGQ